MNKILVMAIAVILFLSGCQAEPPKESVQEKPLILGFSQLGSESAWREGNSRSVKQAAKDAGIQLMFDNAQQKQENQIKAIRSFIAYQVDVIAFAPIVEDGWDAVLKEARDAGIPVLVSDRMITTNETDLYAGFVGSDFRMEGVEAGRFLLKRTNDMEQVKIVEISGTPASTPMKQRASGFREIIASRPKYTIIESISGDFLRSKGKECMAYLLDMHGSDIDVLYSHNDGMTLGAVEAIEAYGLEPGKDIIIITVDGEQAAIDLLKAGKINCVIECTPMIGDTIITLTKRLAAGEAIPRRTSHNERVFSEYDSDLDAIVERGY